MCLKCSLEKNFFPILILGFVPSPKGSAREIKFAPWREGERVEEQQEKENLSIYAGLRHLVKWFDNNC